MIFVTLGSQKFQFNRLLKAVDELVGKGIIKDEVFAQTGYSDYEPVNYDYKQFLDRDEFSEVMGKSDIVITHGGTGAIISAVKKGKKVIAVPRLKEYGEHVDNHQLQLVEQFDEMGIISTCYDLEKLEYCISKTEQQDFLSYKSNTANIINSIEAFLNGRQ